MSVIKLLPPEWSKSGLLTPNLVTEEQAQIGSENPGVLSPTKPTAALIDYLTNVDQKLNEEDISQLFLETKTIGGKCCVNILYTELDRGTCSEDLHAAVNLKVLEVQGFHVHGVDLTPSPGILQINYPREDLDELELCWDLLSGLFRAHQMSFMEIR